MTENKEQDSQPVAGQAMGEKLPAPDLDKAILDSIEGPMGSMQDPRYANADMESGSHGYWYSYLDFESPLSMNQGEPDEESEVKACEAMRELWVESRKADLIATSHVALGDVSSQNSEASVHAFKEILRKHMDDSNGIVVWFGGDVASGNSAL